MLVIQVRLPAMEVERLDMLVESGMYPNRSEAIRDSVRRMNRSVR